MALTWANTCEELELLQLDGKLTFLPHDDQDKKIYVEKSEGSMSPRKENQVCQLK